MLFLYEKILYEPVLNALIFLHNVVPFHDMGIAIIILTILIKTILLPLSFKALQSQKAMQDIQPKIQKLQKELKNDKEKLAAETMKIYKEQKVNPFSSCFPLLIQFPFLIAVYQAFRAGLSNNNFSEHIYPFITAPDHLNTLFLGFVDLAAPSLVLAVLAGIAQYIQTKMFMTKQPATSEKGAKDEAMLANMNKSMQYFMPFMTIIIGMRLPAGLTFYWLLTTVLTTLQQKYVLKRQPAPATEIIPPTTK